MHLNILLLQLLASVGACVGACVGARGLYGEGRRTAVVAETHSPPHIQRSSLALVIEAGGGSEAGRGSEEVETKEKTKKFPS